MYFFRTRTPAEPRTTLFYRNVRVDKALTPFVARIFYRLIPIIGRKRLICTLPVDSSATPIQLDTGRGYPRVFDAIDIEPFVDLLEKRVEDQRMPRLMDQRLRAGVMVDGQQYDTGRGTPQGLLIPPSRAFLPSAPPSLSIKPRVGRSLVGLSPRSSIISVSCSLASDSS